MTSDHDLSGVHVALTTPFDAATGELDLEALVAQVRWLVDEGCDGLVACSRVGEFESLDRSEREAVVETVAAVVDGRTRLIVGVSAPDLRAAGHHAEHAAQLGVDAVLLLPPTNHAPTVAELADHYRSVAQHDVPVIIANDPAVTHIDLTPEILAELGRLDGMVAVVDASGDVRRLSEIAERSPHLAFLCGADDLAVESGLMGATGWISGLASVIPSACQRVFEHARRGEVERARALGRELLPLLRWGPRSRAVEAIKCALDHLGRPGGGTPRPPRRVVDDIDREIIGQQLARARAAR